jgi:hypothetical protein
VRVADLELAARAYVVLAVAVATGEIAADDLEPPLLTDAGGFAARPAG